MTSRSTPDLASLPAVAAAAVPKKASRADVVRQFALRLIGRERYSAAVGVYRLGRGNELKAPYPMGEKLASWRRGFRVENARLYDFPRNDPRLYISDYQRAHRCVRLNPVPELLDNKLFLKVLLRTRGHVQAETVAMVDKDHVLLRPIDADARYVTPAAFERWLREDGGRFIFKPLGGSRGENVFLLRVHDGALERQRGMAFAPFELASLKGPTLVERVVEQGAFGAALCPSTYNTMRVLTMWTPGDDEPFVAFAVQRMGTNDTAPTDNWSGGGICAKIDLETGRLGIGRMHPLKGGRAETAYTHHPDTGTQIEGAVVPHWDRVLDEVLRAARGLLANRYIGWDVIVAADGTPVIIEGNKNTDVNLLQVHGGLLTDARMRRFYERTGVVTTR